MMNTIEYEYPSRKVSLRPYLGFRFTLVILSYQRLAYPQSKKIPPKFTKEENT